MRWLFLTLCLLLSLSYLANAQEKSYQVTAIGFYNLENLFDTIDNPGVNDYEFTPAGPNQWTGDRYLLKVKMMAEVIRQLGSDYAKEGPAFVGVSEIENNTVMQDLVATPALKGYAVVHHDSPDRRGIDVAMVYQPNRFKVAAVKPLPVRLADDTSFRTRDVLLIEGKLDGDPVWVMVTHWPSRSGGEQQSAPKRAAAASVCRKAADSLLELHHDAKIIIMGDLNDDPVDVSLVKYLRARGKPDRLQPGELFDPMWQLYKDGLGSLAYRDSWNLFDQIVISQPLLNDKSGGYRYYKAGIFNKKFLVQKEGQYAGYPFRTYGGGVYQAGYSDHFPVYMLLVREKK